MSEAPEPVDVAASLYRTAVVEGSLDVLELSGAELHLRGSSWVIARAGDGGPVPNALWAHWVRATRAPALERLGERLAATEAATETETETETATEAGG